MRETAGKLSNGVIPIAEVDSDVKEVNVILPPGWILTVMPSNSGASLRPAGARNDARFRKFDCMQTEPAPTIAREEK